MRKTKKRKPRVFLAEDQIEELLDQVIAGKTPKFLAWKYGIVPATVHFHIRERLTKFYRRKAVQRDLFDELG